MLETRQLFLEMREALRSILEQQGEELCRYDHHGYCQTHNMAEGSECWYLKVQKALGAADAYEEKFQEMVRALDQAAIRGEIR